MSEDMPFVEGCYRLEGGEWQVVTARKCDSSDSVRIRKGVRWDSSVTGMNIAFPSDAKISRQIMLDVMARELGVTKWCEVRGPDSIVLR